MRLGDSDSWCVIFVLYAKTDKNKMAAFAAGVAAGAAYIACFFCCKGIQECMERRKIGKR